MKRLDVTRMQTIRACRMQARPRKPGAFTFLLCLVCFAWAAFCALDKWTYIDLGDTGDNGWALGVGDINGDGWPDIVANHYVFVSPGNADITAPWKRVLVSNTQKGYFLYDVDKDGLDDVIANTQQTLYYLRTRDANVSGFDQYEVANNIVPDHNTFEGYIMGDFVKGGNLELILAWGNKTWNMYTIPPYSPTGRWPSVQVCTDALDEGIGMGDVDGDGYLDVAGGMSVSWWKNPGDGSGNWQVYKIGQVAGAGVNRCAIADLNGDQRADVFTVTDATTNNVRWFENPGVAAQPDWLIHNLDSVQGPGHAGDVGDLDGDGDMDLIAASGSFPVNLQPVIYPMELRVYENEGHGQFTSHTAPVGDGDLHNTGKLYDIDKDGDLDIMGIGWLNHNVRIWRNENEQHGVQTKRNQTAGSPLPDPRFEHGALRLDVPGGGPDSVSMLDSRGRLVARQVYHGPQTIQFRVPSVRGVYLWTLQGPGFRQIGKHVAER